MRQIAELYDAIEEGQAVTFDEFLVLLKSYGELEFVYNNVWYGALRLNDDYSSGKDKEWNRYKDYYALYLCENIDEGTLYKTLSEFFAYAEISDGFLLKDVWAQVTDVNYLESKYYHGYPGTHDHQWFGDERGPAVAPDYKRYK